MRRRRRQLSRAEQQLAARELAQTVHRHPVFQRAKSIAFYLARDGEIDPCQLLSRAVAEKRQVFLPRLNVAGERHLDFVRHVPGEVLENNRFGIPEPPYRPAHIRPAWTLDLILVPLVAFDRHGNRLGMGGGYYDRSLEGCVRRTSMRRPQLMGLAHDCQDAGSIDDRGWDVPLDWIATPGGVLRCGARARRASAN